MTPAELMRAVARSAAREMRVEYADIASASTEPDTSAARAAAFKVAADLGIPATVIRGEIDPTRAHGNAWRVNRDDPRRKSPRFLALCARVAASVKARPANTPSNHAKPWKGRLGWSFSSREVAMMEKAIDEAVASMKLKYPLR